ncbi:hypothetical protein H2200_005780 [Cladophialophora chaetospira]|uniref:Uncharacterized protein n=1 Tax=Cladophialophora chaetospira TaxID=386627 RepID=A0AA38XAA3_9EURO|nr:hypothetical protein H2200_005780 [Cladophialophora chaetospira]
MGSVDSGKNEIQFEKFFLTEEEHLKIRRLSQIASREQGLHKVTTYGADNSLYFKPGHTSMRNFLRIIDPGHSASITLIPGAHMATELKVLGACATNKLSPATVPMNRQNGHRDNSGYKVRFEEYDVPPNFTEDPFPFLVALLEEHNYQLPHALTAILTLALLKDGYAQTGPGSGNRAYGRFKQFATAIALDRLVTRFELGADQRNFTRYMNLLDESSGRPYSLAAASGNLRSPDALFRLPKDVNPTKKWTQGQRKMTWLLVKHQVIEKNDHDNHDSWDGHGRRFVYQLLSILLQDLGAALSHAKLCRPAQETAATFSMDDYKESIKELHQATELLSLFFEYFRDEIRLTLKWVAHVCNIKRRRPGEMRSSSKDLAGLEELEMNPNVGWHDDFMYWLQLFDDDFGPVQDSHPWATYRTSKPRLSSQQAVLVPRARIYMLQVKGHSIMDERLPNVNELLDEVLLRYPESKPALKARINANELDANVQGSELQCTMHSEMILFSLHALTMDGMLSKADKSPPTAKEISDCLKASNIDIPTDVIQEFKTVGEILAMTQRCCATCRVFLDKIHHWQHDAPRRRLARPASYGHVQPIALPPWTPRAIGEPVLRFLEGTVRDIAARIYSCQVNENRPSDQRFIDFGPYPDIDPDYSASPIPHRGRRGALLSDGGAERSRVRERQRELNGSTPHSER